MEKRTIATAVAFAGLAIGVSACSTSGSGSMQQGVSPNTGNTATNAGISSKTIDLNASNAPWEDQLMDAMTCSSGDSGIDCAASLENTTFLLHGTATFALRQPGIDITTMGVSRTNPDGGELPAFCPKSVAGCDSFQLGDSVTITFKVVKHFTTNGQIPQLDSLGLPGNVVTSITKQ